MWLELNLEEHLFQQTKNYKFFTMLFLDTHFSEFPLNLLQLDFYSQEILLTIASMQEKQKNNLLKIPYTGDKESLDRCG